MVGAQARTIVCAWGCSKRSKITKNMKLKVWNLILKSEAFFFTGDCLISSHGTGLFTHVYIFMNKKRNLRIERESSQGLSVQYSADVIRIYISTQTLNDERFSIEDYQNKWHR